MWIKLTTTLLFFILLFFAQAGQAADSAQTAIALPIPQIMNIETSISVSSLSPISFEQKNNEAASIFENDESQDLFNLPRLNRLSPSLFIAEMQTSPSYVLVIEFFKVKLTAGLFKHLANPPVVSQWFEQLSHKSKSSRLSGWKDGNSLYTSRITYYS